MKIVDLISLPRQGIVGFVNEGSKIIHLTYTTDSIDCINRNSRYLRDGNHPIKRMNLDFEFLEFKFIEEVKNRNNLKLRCSYWMNYYRNLGYALYDERKKVIYKLDSFVSTGDKLFLYLVSSRNDKHLIGVFNNKFEMDAFIETHYKDSIDKVVYHRNNYIEEHYKELTRLTGCINPLLYEEGII